MQYGQSSVHAFLAHLSQFVCTATSSNIGNVLVWQDAFSMLEDCKSAIPAISEGFAITMPLGTEISIK
jgi:hypothetical protein